MNKKFDILLIFSSFTSVLFVLALIGHLLFSSEFAVGNWSFWLLLVGLLGFLFMSAAWIVIYIREKQKKKVSVTIKRKQILYWLVYIVLVTVFTVFIINTVMDGQRGGILFFIYMIVSATWTVCIYLNDIEKKEVEKAQKENDVEIEQSE